MSASAHHFRFSVARHRRLARLMIGAVVTAGVSLTVLNGCQQSRSEIRHGATATNGNGESVVQPGESAHTTPNSTSAHGRADRHGQRRGSTPLATDGSSPPTDDKTRTEAHSGRTAPSAMPPPPPLSPDEWPIVNDRRLDVLQRRVPFTRPDSRDGRDPFFFATQFLLALERADFARLKPCLHPQSPFDFGGAMVTDVRGHESRPHASWWSIQRATVGRHLGPDRWGHPDASRDEIVVLLRSAPNRPDTTGIVMRPFFTSTDKTQGAWLVYAVETALDGEWLCSATRMVYRRLDRSVAQPEFVGAEALPKNVEGADAPWSADAVAQSVAQLWAEASTGRWSAVHARLLTPEEWEWTTPVALAADRFSAGDSQELVLSRLARAVADSAPIQRVRVLTAHRLAGSPAVFVRTLVLVGHPNGGVPRAFESEWRAILDAPSTNDTVALGHRLKLVAWRPCPIPAWLLADSDSAPTAD